MIDFLKNIKETAKKFKELKNMPVRLISHLDADGLSSSSIIIMALQRENIPFTLMTVRQLDEYVFEELKREDYPILMFLDLGSGSLSQIEKTFPNKEIFILDHHNLEDYKPKKINLINPHLHKIDGGKEISGAGTCYLFAKALNESNIDLAHIAIIGSIGDMQENNGFEELNNFILEDAINAGKIEVRTGLRMFGMQTRPINKVLEYTTDPYIPGVTGNPEGSKQFIEELGIDAKSGLNYKKLIHLNQEDLKKLVTGIILRRLGSEEKPDDVLGKIYILKEEDDESPMKDAKEFSTLLNACGRLNKPSLGIGCCLNDKNIKKEAISLLSEYKREIINALNWFSKNKDKCITEKNFIIINAEDKIKENLIGTLASLVSKSNIYKPETIILSMAYTLDGNIKISIRCNKPYKKDLRNIINEIVENLGGISGGHKYAAGALISQEKEKEFIETAKKVLSIQKEHPQEAL